MQEYELLFGNTAYCFVFSESDRIPPSGNPEEYTVGVSFRADSDYALRILRRPPGRGRVDRAGILRAFSAFLTKFRGYPDCEIAVSIEGKISPLRVSGICREFWFCDPLSVRFLPGERITFADGTSVSSVDCFSGVSIRILSAEEPASFDFRPMISELVRGEENRLAFPIVLSERKDPSGAFRVFFPPECAAERPTESERCAAAAAYLRKAALISPEGEIDLTDGKTFAVCRLFPNSRIAVGLRCLGATRHAIFEEKA